MKLKTNNKEFKKEIKKIEVSANNILGGLKPKLHALARAHHIEVNMINDAEIQRLNQLHRNKNKATDVLSWGYINENLQENELAGEIYISLDTARKQAKEKNHSLEYEVRFLATHGLLHIFEYDHQTDEEEAEMNKVTNKILGNCK